MANIINSVISGGSNYGGIGNDRFLPTVDVKVPLSSLFSTFPTNTSQTTIIPLQTTRVFDVPQDEFLKYVYGIRTRFNFVFKLKSNVTDFLNLPIFCFGIDNTHSDRYYMSGYNSSGQSTSSSLYNAVTSGGFVLSTSYWNTDPNAKSGCAIYKSTDGTNKQLTYISGILGFVYKISNSNRPYYDDSYHRIENVPTNCPIAFQGNNGGSFDINKVDGIDLDLSTFHYIIEYYKIKANNLFHSSVDFNMSCETLRKDLE